MYLIGPDAPLAAIEIEQLLGGAVPCVFFAIYVINQLVSAARQQQQKQAKHAPAPRLPAQGEAAGGPDRLTDEIDQFLRRAEVHREVEAPIEILEVDVLPQKSWSRPLSERIGDASSAPADASMVDSSHLSVEVDQADEQMQEHLQHVFQHEIGKIELESVSDDVYETAEAKKRLGVDSSTPPQQVQPVPAIDFAALLGSTQNVRQAMIMNEILPRPVDRW
jgi:hypothetical protein